MRKRLTLLLLAILSLGASSALAGPPPPARENPLLTASPLPFQAPPFDRIRDTDYQPAIEEGMKRQLTEVAAIAENPEPPTFANTLEAMERSGELLTRASKVFANVDQANTNATLQKIKGEVSPRLAAHQDAIFLNPKLYARVKTLYDKRDTLGLSHAVFDPVTGDFYFVRSSPAFEGWRILVSRCGETGWSAPSEPVPPPRARRLALLRAPPVTSPQAFPCST